ncbi:universal stress protein [Streptomyces camelliae]|uniref:Universal stress protein n=1 Tax=Streptomyces camelliae TaxID=3004093 RepID=A0ABY7PE19_9ACTN|nr:universal stress protein [Streptomyces sp. HUAS 2-6]WBO68129.1 universal stress protein [Streptomyces sp. HUAS 2-6]
MSTAPVIAAVDGSDDSLRALDWAVDAARRRAAPLRVVHVRQYAAWGQADVLVAGPPDAEGDPVLDEVRARLADRAGEPAVEYVALEGVPGAVLPELGSDAELLVLGSRGRGGFASLLLGSNGLAAARDAGCPVVVVPRPGREVHGDGPAEPGPRVVVGLHVDSPDDGTLAFAFAEAALRAARVQVIAAYPWPVQTWSAPGQLMPPALDQDAVESETRTLAEGFLAPHRERHPEVRADTEALPGDAAGHLVAASKEADLVVVGRHRRRLLAPARMMGSVTQAVLLHAASPIAVVPPAPAGD